MTSVLVVIVPTFQPLYAQAFFSCDNSQDEDTNLSKSVHHKNKKIKIFVRIIDRITKIKQKKTETVKSFLIFYFSLNNRLLFDPSVIVFYFHFEDFFFF